MNLPKVITELVKAQNSFDSAAYAQCFAEAATVFDEGKNYTGREEIEQWIGKANKEYKAIMEPVAYDEKENILSAKTSGSFPGSPVVLKYHVVLEEGFIRSLKITG